MEDRKNIARQLDTYEDGLIGTFVSGRAIQCKDSVLS